MGGRVSIVIPNLDSPIVHRAIDRLRRQTARQAIGEVLVVGRDGPGRVTQDEVVRLVDTGRPVTGSRARNLGMDAAAFDRVVLLDADCLVSDAWLEKLLATQEEGWPVVAGGVEPAGSSYWALAYNLGMFHEFLTTSPSGSRRYLPTLDLLLRREVWEDVGGLEEDLTCAEDLEWTARMARAGHRLFFRADAAVVHRHARTSFGAVWSQFERIGFDSRRVRLAQHDVLEAPSLLRHRGLLGALAPLVAAGITARIAARDPAGALRRAPAFAGLYLTKLAWCRGAARRRRP